jgi:hypothetical protein
MPTFPIRIATGDLKLFDVPEESADWPVIGRFALTFDPKKADPYSVNDQSFEAMTPDTDLVHLRSRLFLEQRRWNHYGREPDAAAMDGVRKIISLIKAKLNSLSR